MRHEGPHHQRTILLSHKVYRAVGRLVFIFSRMDEAWASALGLFIDQVVGLVEIPRNTEYRVDRYVRAT